MQPMKENAQGKTTDWTLWRATAVRYLVHEERADARDPATRPLLQTEDVLCVLRDHRVEWLLAGSAVLTAYGAPISPNDFDVVPKQTDENFRRVAAVLEELDAIPAYVEEWDLTLSPEECRRWRPSPAVEGNLDQQFVTRLGVVDIVPRIAGSYDDLAVGGHGIPPLGHPRHRCRTTQAIDLMSDRKKRARAAAISQVLDAVASSAKLSAVAFERMLSGRQD